MFGFKGKDSPKKAQGQTQASTLPAVHWPVFTATYTATSGELPDINVNVTHQSPGIFTVHVSLALTPVGWSIEEVTPYGISPGSETAQHGMRVVSLNLEVRQLSEDELRMKRERSRKISVTDTSFGQLDDLPGTVMRTAPEFITMHLHSQTAAKCGYREGRHWIDSEGRFNLNLISKDLMPSKPRFVYSVQVTHDRQPDTDLPGETR